MRTINNIILNRLAAQGDEADLQGLTKVASNLMDQLEATAEHVRDIEDFYIYSSEQLEDDVEKCLWKAAIRSADYYDTLPDALELQKLIEASTAEFISSFRKLAGNPVIGPHEPTTPGENTSKVVLEVTE